MTRSDTFKAAHALARQTRRAGDDYRATFGLCLKHIIRVEALKGRLLALDLITGVKVWEGKRVYIQAKSDNAMRNLTSCYVDLSNGKLFGAGKGDWSKQATRYQWEDKLRAAARFAA